MDTVKEILLKNISGKDYSFIMIHHSDLASFNEIKKQVFSKGEHEFIEIATMRKFIDMMRDTDYGTEIEYQQAIEFACEMETLVQTNKSFSKYYFPNEFVPTDILTDWASMTEDERILDILKGKRGFFEMVILSIFKVIHYSWDVKRTKLSCIRMLLFALMEYRDNHMSPVTRRKYKDNGKYAVCFIAGYITHHFFKETILTNAAVKAAKPKLYVDKIKKHYDYVEKVVKVLR